MMTIHWIVALLAFLSIDALNIPGRTTRRSGRRDFTAGVPCLKPTPGSTHESGALRQVTEALEGLVSDEKEGNPHPAFLLGLV